MQVLQADPLSSGSSLFNELDCVVILSTTHWQLQIVLTTNLSFTKFLKLLWWIISWRYDKQSRSFLIDLLWHDCRKSLSRATNSGHSKLLCYVSVEGILQPLWFEDHEDENFLEGCQPITNCGKLLFWLLTFVPWFEFLVVEIELFGQFGEIKAKRVEHFLTIESGPWRKDDFVLNRRRDESSEELPLLGWYLLRKDAFYQIQPEGKSILLEQGTGDVIEHNFIDFIGGNFESWVNGVLLNGQFGVGIETAQEEFGEILESESVHVVDLPQLGQDQVQDGSFLGQGTVSVTFRVQLGVQFVWLSQTLLYTCSLDFHFGQVVEQCLILENVSWGITQLLEQLFLQSYQWSFQFFFFVE